MLKHVLLTIVRTGITCLNPRSDKHQKTSQSIILPTCCETLALIHAQCMFPSHKSMLVKIGPSCWHTFGLNAETCAINYCQKRDYIPVPQIKQSSNNITVCCTPRMPWNICFDPCSCQVTLSQKHTSTNSCCMLINILIYSLQYDAE